MKANIRTYLWGHESFTNTLKNDFVWDVDKYWELEIFLLNIIKEIENKEAVDKSLKRLSKYLKVIGY